MGVFLVVALYSCGICLVLASLFVRVLGYSTAVVETFMWYCCGDKSSELLVTLLLLDHQTFLQTCLILVAVRMSLKVLECKMHVVHS